MGGSGWTNDVLAPKWALVWGGGAGWGHKLVFGSHVLHAVTT